MRLGLFGARMDSTGLGVQTHAYYRNLHPSKTLVVDISALNHMPQHREWYNAADTTFITGFPSDAVVDDFLHDVDVVLTAEIPYNYRLYSEARKRGIKTVLAYNYEFLDHLRPGGDFPMPDVLAAPTNWNIDTVRRLPGANVINLPVPTDLDELPRRTVTKARRFFHIAGRPAIHDRNGTLDFIAACRLANRLVLDGVEFILYCQQPTPQIQLAVQGTPVQLIGHVDNPADMYRKNDILVLPRRYGGLCLVAQEAAGCGIPVLMPNISPNASWLPREWLMPVLPQRSVFTARTAIEVRNVSPSVIANRMVQLARDDAEVAAMGQQAVQLAERMSWEALLPLYKEVLCTK